MLEYVYDIEVFPNFFCATFLNPKDESDIKVFVIAEKRNDTKALLSFMRGEMRLYGFNNILYDGAVLHFIKTYVEETEKFDIRTFTSQLFLFSGKIIAAENRRNYDQDIRNHQYPTDVLYKQIDLMKMMAFDKLGVSLKQISINLLWHKVQDLPLPYDHIVQPFEYDIILDYNLNDVQITNKLLHSLASELELREKLSEEYGVDLMSASDSKMANVILEDMYTKRVGVSVKDIRNLRTRRDSVNLRDCLGKGIGFKTNTLKRIKREIEEKVVHVEDNFKYSKTVKFANMTYQLGVGGLHSDDSPNIYRAGEDMILADFDVSSYYPSIMINNNLYPEHLDPQFVDILLQITRERLEAKANKDKIKADSLKITINSIFGKLGSDTFWLYDPKQMLSVTVSGQLYLLMLIESLVLEGIEVISANTDGIVTYFHKSLESKANEILSWWQGLTGFSLEATFYTAYFRSDVNNYITIKPDGKTKEKGRYLKDVSLKKGYRYPVVPHALYNYFVKNIPVMDTLKESTSILDFCVSQKVGGDFVLEFHKDDKVETLQKNNRFFVSLDGGKLIKRRISSGSEIGLYVGQLTTVINDYDETIPLDNYHVDYAFYETEAYKYIQEVENNQKIPFAFTDEPENYVPPEVLKEAEREAIVSVVKGIKGFPDKVIDNLAQLEKEFSGDDFIDLLVYAEENSLISSKYKDLIRIGFFAKYGASKKLLRAFEAFTKGKNHYGRSLSEKSKAKRLEQLRIDFIFDRDEDFTLREKIQNEVEITGSIRSCFNDVDERYAFIQEIDTKNAPKITLQVLHSGVKKTIKVRKNTFTAHPFQVGDILLCKEFRKEAARRRNEKGEWESVPDRFDWWLEIYYVTKPEDEFVKKKV